MIDFFKADGMDIGALRAGFVMKAVLLLACDIKQAADNGADQHDCAQPHIDEAHGERAEDQPGQQAADAPIDEFSGEATKRGRLKSQL